MSRLLLCEINARCWVRERAAQLGRPATLADAPDEALDLWVRQGFTHVWLMGVWQTGPRSRQAFLALPDTSHHLTEALPGWVPSDVVGSPYAIRSYQVLQELGGDTALQHLRQRLDQRGLQLILDFIPNHVGLDHPWLLDHPERFIALPPGAADGLEILTRHGPRRLAHGKDPFFPPWLDTVQLDLRRADTRQALRDELRSIVARCDGVRCDMAMLLLNDIFARQWGPLAGQPDLAAEFWADTLAAVRRPGFLFLAEAYWDMEERLQQLGFDLTYDKRVTDLLMDRDGRGLKRLLLGRHPDFLRRAVHFLENHDEPRVAGRLSLAEHRAAALLILALPGAGLLHDGQLTGARLRASVHLARRAVEPADPQVQDLYTELLEALGHSPVGQGDWRFLQSRPVAAPDSVDEHVVAIWWAGAGGEFDLVLSNPSGATGSCRFELPAELRPMPVWRMSHRLGTDRSTRQLGGGDVIALDVPAHAAHWLHFVPA